jgi:hypothetical protein
MKNRQDTLMEEENGNKAGKEGNEVSGEILIIRGNGRRIVRHDDLPDPLRYSNKRKRLFH